MKCLQENGVYQIEPETDREADAVETMLRNYAARGVTTGDAAPANHSRPSCPTPYTGDEAR